MAQPKPVIGLAGGIGSGKSLVASEFERLGCVVIDSDRLNHEILQTPQVQHTMKSWWGDDLVAADGRTRRERIAQIVFNDSAQRKRLEALVFPLIDARRLAIIDQSIHDPTVSAIILDSPLLFESGLDRQCDAIVFVDADEPTRLDRLRTKRGWDSQQLLEREKWQKSLDFKRHQSDYTIINQGPPESLSPQVSEILSKILRRVVPRPTST